MSLHEMVASAERHVDAVEALASALVDRAEARLRVEFEARAAADRATIAALQERLLKLETEVAERRGWWR